jgi:nucleotide-binding universal stress UspA family protein
MKISTILVPMDGSVLAEAALAPAVELARERGAKLLLLRAAEAHTLPMADPTEAQVAAVRDAEQYLADMRDRAMRGDHRRRRQRVVRSAGTGDRGGRAVPQGRPDRHVQPRPQRPRPTRAR